MAEFFTSKEHGNFTSIWRADCETVTSDFKLPMYFLLAAVWAGALDSCYWSPASFIARLV